MLTPTAAKAAHLMTTATRTTDTPTASTATEVTATLMADTDTAGTGTAGTGTPTAAGVEAWMLIWEVCVYGDALKTGVCGKPDKILMFFFLLPQVFFSMSWLTHWEAWAWSSPPSSFASSAGWSLTRFARSSLPRSFFSASSLWWRTPVRFSFYDCPQKMRRTWTARWKR